MTGIIMRPQKKCHNIKTLSKQCDPGNAQVRKDKNVVTTMQGAARRLHKLLAEYLTGMLLLK